MTDPAGLDPQLALATIKESLWRRGELRWKLHETQKRVYDRVKAGTDRRHFLNCSRRLGKSMYMLSRAVETCLRIKNARVIYVAPWARDAADIANDNGLILFEDCPDDLKPKYQSQAKELYFPSTGGLVRFRGTNGDNAKDLRGAAVHLAILDEAGTMDDFENVLYSIIEPMTLTTRGGILIGTTPSETQGHDSFGVYEDFSRQGLVSVFTLNDAPHLSYQDKFDTLKRLGENPDRIPLILSGKVEPETTRAKREYYCQWVTEGSRAVVPEYDAAARTEIVREVSPPPYRDCYTAMDPGYVDNSGILFGYFDFLKQQLVIEDEWVENHAGTDRIAEAILAKEKLRFGPAADAGLVMRVSDVDKRLIRDLRDLYDIGFVQANKKDSNASIQLMRRWVQTRQIIIHPRCTNLDRQLRNAIWNKRGKDFERDGSEDSIDGHYDLVAALKYLVRFANTHRNHNPYPSSWNAPGPDMHVPMRNPRRQTSTNTKKTLYDDTPLARRILKGRRLKFRKS